MPSRAGSSGFCPPCGTKPNPGARVAANAAGQPSTIAAIAGSGARVTKARVPGQSHKQLGMVSRLELVVAPDAMVKATLRYYDGSATLKRGTFNEVQVPLIVTRFSLSLDAEEVAFTQPDGTTI